MKTKNDERSHITLRRNRYEVLERLSLPDRGRWLVLDHRPPPKGTRCVAILLPDSEATSQLRRTLMRLPPHASSLPRLIDHGRVGQDYCLIVDWCKGVDLSEYLSRIRSGKAVRPSPTELVRLFRSVAHSLRLLHDVCQVVHGDLKPANLILTVRPSSLRMIDFGSSWQIEKTKNRASGDGSDPIFSAPENYLPDALACPASDQFSIGVVLYLMLTLQVPFDGLGGKVGHENYRDSFLEEDYRPEPPSRLMEAPERIPKEILQELDSLVLRMIRIKPEERFPNSRAWANAFDRLQMKIKIAADEAPGPPLLLDWAMDTLASYLRRLKAIAKGK